MISLVSSHLSLSYPQLQHHLRTQRQVIPLNLSMPWSWVNTECRIYWVLHHPKIECRPLPASFISDLSVDLVELNSLHSQNDEFTNELSLSSHHALFPIHRIQIDSLQVVLQSRPIMAECIFSLARLQPATASPSSHDLGLQVHLQTSSITASNCISAITRSRPPSES